jgi:ATP phosphoribosyltransferase
VFEHAEGQRHGRRDFLTVAAASTAVGAVLGACRAFAFIANERADADAWKRQKMDDLVLTLQGAMAAEGKVGLMMNVPTERLDAVLSIQPALQKPTVSSLSDRSWVAVNTIIDESVVRHIVPQLKQAGARGIVAYPLNKILGR